MGSYKHILVGLDLSEESTDVLKKAIAVAQDCSAALTLAHIIEPLAFGYGGDMPMDLSGVQHSMEEQATKRLAGLAQAHSIEPKAQLISVGGTAGELHRLAREQLADLIIVGSHGRHGIALLLGSTAGGVLHGAQCDVLAVRV